VAGRAAELGAREPAPAGERPAAASRWTLDSRRVGAVAAALIALQLTLRGWVAARGYFYWDDLILTGRAGRYPLLSTQFLRYDHDGHFMPAAFLSAGIATRLAPLDWAAPVAMLVALQALASVSVYRLLRLILDGRAVLLIPLTGYLFSPLTLPSYAWWSAALNALPLQAGLAWVSADAIQLCRTGRRRFAVSGTLAFAVSLLFFEKSLVVPVVAAAAAVLLRHVDGAAAPLRTVARRGLPLWSGVLVVTAVWAWLYTSTVHARPTDLGARLAAELSVRGVSLGLLPSLLGGPWTWDKFDVSTPWAAPPALLVGIGWLVLAAAVTATLIWKARIGWVWIGLAGYVVVDLAVMVVGRSGPGTVPQLAQTLRYLADSSVVVAAGVALILRAPARSLRWARWGAWARPGARARAAGWLVAGGVFLAGSLCSTATFTRMWADGVTRGYLQTATASLAAHASNPLLDQPIASRVLFGLAYPNNLAAQVFSPLTKRPEFGTSTPELTLIDDTGAVVPAHVATARQVTGGQSSGCAHPVSGPTPAVLPLSGPLLDWDWTLQLGYRASDDGSLSVSLATGPPVTVPVRRGTGQVFVRLRGQGSTVRVRAADPGLSACIVRGVVGLVEVGPDRAS
jgi:hypothetical protein